MLPYIQCSASPHADKEALVHMRYSVGTPSSVPSVNEVKSTKSHFSSPGLVIPTFFVRVCAMCLAMPSSG